MEAIRNMFIRQITMKNFRNQEDKTVKLDAVTLVSGHNGVGKTTLAHAVSYALYGVTFHGFQDIDRLRCCPDRPVQVTLAFTDQDGQAHSLTRIRTGDKTELTLDAYTVRQAEINRLLCDKAVFLSMFNPLYFPTQGTRELLMKYLKPVPIAEALSQMTEPFRRPLEGMEILNPTAMLQDTRKQVHSMEDRLLVLEGRLDAAKKAEQTRAKQLAALQGELQESQKQADDLLGRQFQGIDRDALTIKQGLLIQQLDQEPPHKADVRLRELYGKLEAVKQKVYASKFTQPIADTSAQLQAERQNYANLKQRLDKLQPGSRCPYCLTPITEQNANEARTALSGEIRTITEKGKNLIQQLRQLKEYAAEEAAVFEQFREDDLAKIQAQIQTLEEQAPQCGRREKLRQELADVEETLRMGALTEAEFSTLVSLQADIAGIQSQMEALSGLPIDAIQQAEDAYRQLSQDIRRGKELVSSLSELIAQQTALAVKQMHLPHVSIKLWEVVHSTGELRSVFRLLYNGREFVSLSLSEQVLAGLEIAKMLRQATGLTLPVCIDNAESLAALPHSLLPEQTILMKVAKNRPLTVQIQGREPQAPSESLQKAA